MKSIEEMTNQDRVERIIFIRELRRKLGNIKKVFMEDEDKAVALRALNDYEFSLETDIKKSINTSMMLDDEGIPHQIDMVNIPKDLNRPSYEEFSNIGVNESLNTKIIRIKNIADIVPLLGLLDDELRVFLEALKNYCKSLQILQVREENNQKAYGHEYETDLGVYIVPGEISSIESLVPTTSQFEIQNEEFEKLFDNKMSDKTDDDTKRK